MISRDPTIARSPRGNARPGRNAPRTPFPTEGLPGISTAVCRHPYHAAPPEGFSLRRIGLRFLRTMVRFLFPAPGRRRLTFRGTVVVCGVMVGLGSIAMTARLALRDSTHEAAAVSPAGQPVAETEMLDDWHPVDHVSTTSPLRRASATPVARASDSCIVSDTPLTAWKRTSNREEADPRGRQSPIPRPPEFAGPDEEIATVDNAHWESHESPVENVPLWPASASPAQEPAHLQAPRATRPVERWSAPPSHGRNQRVRTAAILLLANARRDLSEGKLLEAWQKAHAAAGLDAIYEAFDDHPDLLLAEIEQQLRNPRQQVANQEISPTAEAPPTDSSFNKQAKSESDKSPLAFQTPTGTLRVRFDLAPWDEILQTFARETGSPLQAETFPAGSLTYADAKEYTAPEMMDLLNGFMASRKFVLVRSNGQLVVVNTARGIPTDLVPAVPVESLESRGENELLSIQVSAQGRSTAEASHNVAPFLGPFGNVAAGDLPDTILISDTGRNLRRIHYILSREVANRPEPAEGPIVPPAETLPAPESTDEAARPLEADPVESSRAAELTGELTRLIPRARQGAVERTSYEGFDAREMQKPQRRELQRTPTGVPRPGTPRSVEVPVIQPRVIPNTARRTAS